MRARFNRGGAGGLLVAQLGHAGTQPHRVEWIDGEGAVTALGAAWAAHEPLARAARRVSKGRIDDLYELLIVGGKAHTSNDTRFCSSSVQPEVHLDCDSYRDWFAVLFCGLELVSENGFKRFFIEAHAKMANDVQVLRIALGVDDQRDGADALELGSTRFIRELRFRRHYWNWRGDVATRRVDAIPIAGAISGTLARSIAAAFLVANPRDIALAV